jgi:DNA-directed RNA polymerase specialized sigma24 family protein
MTAADVVRLYVAFHRRLERMVGGCVRAPGALIEDACQVAWLSLIAYRERIDLGRAPGWLVQTAMHEALRLVALEDREDSLEEELEEHVELAVMGTDPGPEVRVMGWQRVFSLTALPVRQQRLVWLRALGLSYEEIASHEHCTGRTVRRQLERAGRTLRTLDAEHPAAA